MYSPLNGDLEQLVLATVSIVIVLEKTQRKLKENSIKSIEHHCQWLIKLKFSDQRKKERFHQDNTYISTSYKHLHCR